MMGKFNFRLASILNIKEKFEEQKEIELGNAMIELNQQLERLEGIQLEKSKFVIAFESKHGKSIKAKVLIELNSAIRYYAKEIKQQQIRIDRAGEKVELKREELKKAVLERKTYEKLKERALEDYMEREKVEDNKLLDEIVSYKYS